ncbi:MAG: hypothetical protein IKA87_00720 [Lentisphaeria bacterium]|nr:hypothetical protein [Lentisphaeria bacterium]
MSVWSDMGLINGEMRGVDPCVFLNTAFRFFQDLQYRTRVSVDPDFEPPEICHFDFSFDRMPKFFQSFPDAGKVFYPWQYFSYYYEYSNWHPQAARGFPIPEETWQNEKPDLNAAFLLGEKGILGEDIIEHNGTREPINDIPWALQRYRLIQKMRFVTVPLAIRVFDNSIEKWSDYRLYDGYFSRHPGRIDSRAFDWCLFPQIEAQIPEYWQKEGTVCKIGINAKKGAYIIYPPPPVTGDLWKQGAYFKSAKYEGRYPQESDLMIYAAVDLASHPDFKKYFDLEAI